MPNLLDVLSLFGEDALQNHYNIIITGFPFVDDISNVNLRLLGIDIPAQALATYEIIKRGKKLTRVSGLSEQGNEFTFTYRPDKFFRNYNSISRWLGYIQNPSSVTMGSDSGPLGVGGPSTYRTTVIVQGLDANNVITNLWTFLGCFPSSQDALSFTESTGDPFEISVTMQYATILYPTLLP